MSVLLFEELSQSEPPMIMAILNHTPLDVRIGRELDEMKARHRDEIQQFHIRAIKLRELGKTATADQKTAPADQKTAPITKTISSSDSDSVTMTVDRYTGQAIRAKFTRHIMFQESMLGGTEVAHMMLLGRDPLQRVGSTMYTEVEMSTPVAALAVYEIVWSQERRDDEILTLRLVSGVTKKVAISEPANITMATPGRFHQMTHIKFCQDVPTEKSFVLVELGRDLSIGLGRAISTTEIWVTLSRPVKADSTYEITDAELGTDSTSYVLKPARNLVGDRKPVRAFIEHASAPAEWPLGPSL